MNIKKLLSLILPLILIGCNHPAAPTPEAVVQGYSLIVTHSDQLANEYLNDFEITAGDPVNLGIKLLYSDGTKKLVPTEGIYWEIKAAQNSVTLKSNQLRGLLVGNYQISATFDPNVVKNITTNFVRNFKVNSGLADHLKIVSGDNQNGIVANELSQKIEVKVLDLFENAVANSLVTFYYPNSTTPAFSVKSDENGLASTKYSLIETSGVQLIKAEIGNFVKKSVVFTTLAIAQDPVSLVFKSIPLTALAGQAFGIPVSVVAKDKYGNDVLTDSRDIVISSSLDPACANTDLSNNLITQSTTIHSINGVSSYIDTSYKKAESFYLKATASGLVSACSNKIKITPNVPTSLKVQNLPTSEIKAGVVFNPALSVSLSDYLGNIVNDQEESSIAITSYLDPTCTVPSINTVLVLPKTSFLGTSYFPDFSLNYAEVVYLKSSTIYKGRNISACSSSVKIIATDPSQIVFLSYPAQGVAGQIFTTTLVTKDHFGNLSPYYESTMTASVYTNALCSVPALGTATYSDPLPYFNKGVSTLNVSYTKAEPIYLKVSTAEFSICSGVINIKASTPYKISFINQPGSYNGIIGKFLTDIPQVAVKDVYNNDNSESGGVISITPYSDNQCLTQGVSGSFTGNPVNVIGGIANFTNISYTGSDTIYFKAAYVNSGSTFYDCSVSVNFNPDLSNVALDFEVQPSLNAIAGNFFAQMPVVSIKDNFGNYVNPSGSVALSSYLDPSCSQSFKSTGQLFAAPVSFLNGKASFSKVYYNKAEKIYLKASYGGIFKCSSAINVLGSSINSIGFLNLPQNIKAGEPFSPFDIVTKDNFDNIVSSSGNVSIKAFTNSNCTVGVSGNFFSTTTPVNQGFAHISNLTYNQIGLIYLKSVYSNDPYNLSSDCSAPINVKPGAPNGMIISVNSPLVTKVNKEFIPQPEVKLIDQYNNVTEAFGSAAFDFYQDSACSIPINFVFRSDIINGVSQNPHVLINSLGSYYLKASVSFTDRNLSICSNSATLVQSIFNVTMAKTVGKSNELLPVNLISDSPVHCTVSVNPESYSVGYLQIQGSSVSSDCKNFTLGVNNGLIPFVQDFFISDDYNQSVTFKIYTVPVLKANFSNTSLQSKEQVSISLVPLVGVHCSLNSSIGSIISPDCTKFQAGANYKGNVVTETITFSDNFGQVLPVPVTVQPDSIVGGKISKDGSTNLGSAVSIYNNLLAIGDSQDNNGCGAVYIYKDIYGYKDKSYWNFQTKIVPTVCRNNVNFGSSLSISDKNLVVGAPGDSGAGMNTIPNAGAVYVYSIVNESFIQENIIRETSMAANDQFGFSVSLSNGHFVSSAPGANNNQGKAHVYKLINYITNEWGVLSTLTPTDSTGFGSSVSIYYGYTISRNSGYVAIGSPGDLTSNGKVYVYSNSNDGDFSNVVSFNSPNSSVGDKFGAAVSLFGPYLAIGSPNKDSKGAAYVYKNLSGIFGWAQTNSNTWSSPIELQPITLSAGAAFGSSVSLFGNYLAIGSPAQASLGGLIPTVGSSFIYRRLDNQLFTQNDNTSWIQNLEITSENVNPTASFGNSISIYNNRIAIGSNTNSISSFAGNWILNTWPFGFDGPISIAASSKTTLLAGGLFDYSSIDIPASSTLSIEQSSMASLMWTFIGSKNDLNLNGKILASGSGLTGPVSSFIVNDNGTLSGKNISATIQDQIPAGKGGSSSSTPGASPSGATGGNGANGEISIPGGSGGFRGDNGLPIVIRTNSNINGAGMVDVSGTNGLNGINGSSGTNFTPIESYQYDCSYGTTDCASNALWVCGRTANCRYHYYGFPFNTWYLDGEYHCVTQTPWISGQYNCRRVYLFTCDIDPQYAICCDRTVSQTCTGTRNGPTVYGCGSGGGGGGSGGSGGSVLIQEANSISKDIVVNINPGSFGSGGSGGNSPPSGPACTGQTGQIGSSGINGQYINEQF